MPTLVAVKVAPTKTARSAGWPSHDMTAVADGERRRHADEGDERGLRPGPQQLTQVGLQADLEQKDQDAELGQGVQHLRLVDQPQDAGADEHARQQLAQDRGLADPLHGLARQLGGEPDQDEAQEQVAELQALRYRLDSNAAHLVLSSASVPASFTNSTAAPSGVAARLPGSAPRVSQASTS